MVRSHWRYSTQQRVYRWNIRTRHYVEIENMLQVNIVIYNNNVVSFNVARRFFRMNNDTEDAVRLEVKLFSGYYFDKISSASMSNIHHDSHSNHIWFVFAQVRSYRLIMDWWTVVVPLWPTLNRNRNAFVPQVKSNCVVCVSYTAKSMQKVTGLRPAVAKVYVVSRPDQSAYKLFHVDEEQNPLAEGLTDMQIADWITNDSNGMPCCYEHLLSDFRATTFSTSLN